MPAPIIDNFVSPEWLESHLKSPGVIVVDASWYLPTDNRDPHKEYLNEHIPGAVFFDIEAITDKSSTLPHMLPDPIAFGSAMRKLGIGGGHRIVVYDGSGLFSAPRVWWTFRAFGARDVVILEGGLPVWKAEGRELEDGPVRRMGSHFSPRKNHGAVASVDDVRGALATGSAQVVDARSAARFSGDAPEPRPGLRSGHMPGSFNVPWTEVVENGQLKSPETIAKIFTDAGVDIKKPIITTCGSGISAAILGLALESTGHVASGLYDASWCEWGARPELPVAKGA